MMYKESKHWELLQEIAKAYNLKLNRGLSYNKAYRIMKSIDKDFEREMSDFRPLILVGGKK